MAEDKVDFLKDTAERLNADQIVNKVADAAQPAMDAARDAAQPAIDATRDAARRAYDAAPKSAQRVVDQAMDGEMTIWLALAAGALVGYIFGRLRS